MNPERWQRIKQICQSALEHGAGERGAFLACACDGDAQLRREVESLLAKESKADHFIEESALVLAAQQLAAEPVTITSGYALGPYQILSLLGKGGMGEVYRAHDARLGRNVAVKVLPAIYASDGDRWSRFEQEARVAGVLNHPNIVTIHDIGTHEGSPAIIFELLEGETLRERLGTTTPAPLALNDALQYALQIARGLAAAHEKGIAHRDLKPENLFITDDGRVKILDFGLAKLTEQNNTSKAEGAIPPLSGAGTILGTVGYMAPEQVRGEPSDHCADIFAFGVVVYEMVSGQPPFRGASAAEVMDAIVKAQPRPLPDVSGMVLPTLDRVISRCLRKDPRERFQSMLEVAAALESLSKNPETADVPAHAPRTWITGRAAGISIAAAAVIAFLALWWWQTSHRPSATSGRQVLVSMFPGSHRAASFSPDGSMIAFLNAVGGVPQVWIKNLAAGEPRQITFGELPAHRPRWSPVSDQIVFAVGPSDGPQLTFHSIWSVPVRGGTPRKIVADGTNPNWSFDGTRLVFERRGQIWTAKADGGDPERLEGVPTLDTPYAERTPCFSPDGLQIAFFHPDGSPRGDLWVIPSRGGQARRITFDSALGGSPVWAPNGRFIFYSAEHAGSLTLFRVSPAGGPAEPALISAGEDDDPDISRDGRRLIYTTARDSFILTVLDPSTGSSRELTEARAQIVAPIFSPQGDRIAFFAHVADGGTHIFTIDSTGYNRRSVTRGEGERNTFPQWSGDGRALYFYQEVPAHAFRKISVDGGRSSEVVTGWTWDAQQGAQVEATGERVVYTRRQENAFLFSTIRDLRSGTEMPLGVPLQSPRWSRDGRFITGVNATSGATRRGQVVICPVGGTACRELTRGYAPMWSRDDQRILFLRPADSDDQEELWSAAMEGGDERRLGSLRRMYPIGHRFDVSPTGEVVYVHHKLGRPELCMTDLDIR